MEVRKDGWRHEGESRVYGKLDKEIYSNKFDTSASVTTPKKESWGYLSRC